MKVRKRKLIMSRAAMAFFAMATLLLLSMLAPVFASGSSSSDIVTIIRDNYGVPHVFASTREGLAYGAGYAVAQDRLWQADLFRRQATGRLAEFGLAPVEYDYWLRLNGYSREENTELFNELPSPYKEMITAYTKGMNRYILEAIIAALFGDYSLMPIEYLGLSEELGREVLPELWTEEDTLAIAQMMVRRWGEAGGNELEYAAAFEALTTMHGLINGSKIFDDRFPQVDPGADTTLDWKDDCGSASGSSLPPDFPDGIVESAETIAEMKELDQQVCESLGLFYHFGSNGWVVAPSKSESGNALLLGGPQMGHSIPQIVLDIGMHGSDIDAVGMTFPGVGPAVLIGVSKWGAWTTTSGVSDEVDTYIEELNDTNPFLYKFNNKWLPMEIRTETIYDALGNPHEFECYRTIHGPVIDFNPSEGYAISQKRTFWKQERGTLEGVMSFQECKNIDEFANGVSKVVSSHNWLWADRYGNVGYFHAGWYPIRPESIDDRFPLDGTGNEEWLGILPFEELPQGTDPPDGFYANWNNKPRADWPYAEVDWGEGHIVVRIQELLDADPKISFQDMIDICQNVAYHNVYGTYFKLFLLEAIGAVGGISQDVIDALEDWNCYLNDADFNGIYDDPGLTIFMAWFEAIDNAIFDDELGDIGASHSLLLHLFQGEESKLELLYDDYLGGVSRDVMIVSVLQGVIDHLNATIGPDVSQWLTPVEMVDFDEQGFLPSPEMPYMNRGTYNQIAEMPKWSWRNWWKPPIAVNVIPPGQSGFVGAEIVDGEIIPVPSPHAYDQLPLYVTWQFKPMLHRLRDIWNVAESWKILIYL
jgi:penicillin amidase